VSSFSGPLMWTDRLSSGTSLAPRTIPKVPVWDRSTAMYRGAKRPPEGGPVHPTYLIGDLAKALGEKHKASFPAGHCARWNASCLPDATRPRRSRAARPTIA